MAADPRPRWWYRIAGAVCAAIAKLTGIGKAT